MAEWHFYASGPSPTGRKQWTTGTPTERAAITRLVDTALQWQNETGIRTWVGAWMAGDYNKGNHYTIAQQTEFANFVAGTLDAAKIPFSVNTGSRFYDYATNKWRPDMAPILAVILKPGTLSPLAATPTGPGAFPATSTNGTRANPECYNKRGKLRRRCAK